MVSSPPGESVDAQDSRLLQRRPPRPPPKSKEAVRILPPASEPRFTDEGEVARGGMSSIRKVVDRRLGRREAMKVLDAKVDRTSRAAERFLREARITGALDHPNIVPIYDLGLTAEGAPQHITMKLVEGESFAEMLERQGDARLESEQLERSIQILLKVCDALSFAHGRGILHCDVKPHNIMVGSHGQVYLMDWGLSVATPAHAACSVDGWTPRPQHAGTVSGTPAYMSPEQAHGRTDQIDARTDVFCLGGTLYRVLTGRAPYYEPTVLDTLEKARACRPQDPELVVQDPRLPPELCRIAMKALSASPAKRQPSVHAFRHDLERFLRGGGWLPTRTYAPDEIILSEGEPATAAYLVIDGVVEVFKTVNGKRVALRLIGPGEVFGEAAVFSSSPRTASVMAKSEVTVKLVTAESMERELAKNDALRILVRTLANRFRDLDTELARKTQPPPPPTSKG
ncbi:MAG: cyclic nucleotide-binding domain-containing protein [Polyangiaceae bacterium]